MLNQGILNTLLILMKLIHFKRMFRFFYPPEKKKLLAFYCFLGLEHSLRFRFLDLDLGLDSWAEI